VDLVRLTGYTRMLTELYGPRHHTVNKVFTDRSCTLGGTAYLNSNLVRASKSFKDHFEALGYPFTKEYIPDGSGGYNVVATKTGNLYPDVFIEIAAHIDSKDKTPGASDNAGSVAAVMEIGTLLKDYPNRYSLRFISYIGEEYGRTGSKYHAAQIVNRGEALKASLVMDGIGWSEIAPQHMNCLWAEGAPENLRVAQLFDAARQQYGIDIAWRLCTSTGQVSDNVSYWEKGLPSVASFGGLPYVDPNYHKCTDDMQAIDMQNAYKTTQENLAVLLWLDAEPWSSPAALPADDVFPVWTGGNH
jgi:hypothetical protein